jgi:hypothetical protein
LLIGFSLEDRAVFLEIKGRIVLEGLKQTVFPDRALGMLLAFSALDLAVQFLVLFLPQLLAFALLNHGDALLHVLLHFLTDQLSGSVHCVPVGKREVGDRLLVHAVIVLSGNGFLPFRLDSRQVFTHDTLVLFFLGL